LLAAPHVDVGEWQAIQGGPATLTAELEDVSFETRIAVDMDTAQQLVKPNLPWAEEHFQERVSGTPYNPPPSHERWPFRRQNNAEHVDVQGQFSHTYPERFWPKYAHQHPDTLFEREGIRFAYGDVSDVIKLLSRRRHTRQAYLPIWFPEDLTASVAGERVPCSLGYHFMIRDDALSVRYVMRSVDFLRHFRDDVYMAMRLAQWVAHRVRPLLAGPGKLVMHISSLHIFPPADVQLLEYRKSKGQ
jgi:thymidylate synthase